MRPPVISRRDWWLDACLLFVLAATLVFPLFRLKYLDNWPSIESTFIADGRMLQANWPHHLWQPLWYCGTRADYVYPPGLRDGVAIFSTLLRLSPARSYHLFIGLFYAFGISALYLWARTGTGSRSAAWLAAAGVALISPCFLILPDVRMDSPFLVPWRLHVLMKYGEGPHISALSVLPLAWLGAWRRFLGGGVRWLILSAGAAALVVTINFYGATALAITLPLAAWSCFLQRRDWRIIRDAFFIAALAYGLTAWWLVPSYLRITSRNLRLVSPEGNKWSVPVALIILAVYIAVSLVLRRLRRFDAYSFFIYSGLWFLGVYVLGYRWFGLQVAGSSMRLVPEMDLFAILCAVQLAGSIWIRLPNTRVRLADTPRRSSNLVLCFLPSGVTSGTRTSNFLVIGNGSNAWNIEPRIGSVRIFRANACSSAGQFDSGITSGRTANRPMEDHSKAFSIHCYRPHNGGFCMRLIRRWRETGSRLSESMF